MPKSLKINTSKESGTDKRSGRNFTYDNHYVEVNNLKIAVVPKGSTAWQQFLNLIESGANLSLLHEVVTYAQQDGTTKDIDSLYIEIDGEHLPMTTKDSYGRSLVLKYLKS